jgi:hypothetical protein
MSSGRPDRSAWIGAIAGVVGTIIGAAATLAVTDTQVTAAAEQSQRQADAAAQQSQRQFLRSQQREAYSKFLVDVQKMEQAYASVEPLLVNVS